MARRTPVWLDAQAPLAEWYSSGLGQSILDELERLLAARLGGVFGYQGLQIGNPAPHRNLLAGAGLQRCLRLDAPGRLFAGANASAGERADASLSERGRGARAHLAADVGSLPIASDSIKAVLLFHTLDFCEQPHQALREADRVLVDDGQLLIIGFNPFSSFGLRGRLAPLNGRTPWDGHFWSRRRVADWLSVLDYRVLCSQPLFLRPPINSERLLRRLGRLERLGPLVNALGGLYVIQARKQTLPMTPVRRPWLAKRGGMAVGVRAGSYASAGHRPHRAGVVSLDSVRRAR